MTQSEEISAEPAVLCSPDGRLIVKIWTGPEPSERETHQNVETGCLFYSIEYNGAFMIEPSRLGLEFDGAPSLRNCFEVLELVKSDRDETWRPLYGERAEIVERYRALRVSLRETISPKRELVLEWRAYDEGVAFRYLLPKQPDLRELTLWRELTTFTLPEGTVGYSTEHAQGLYRRLPVAEIPSKTERPLTLELPGRSFAAICEAGMMQHSRMKLAASSLSARRMGYKKGSDDPNALVVELDDPMIISPGEGSSWRVILVADRPGALLENNHLLLSLNAPSEIEDTSWIVPGKCIREVTLSTAGGKRCVDFAVARGLRYIELDAGWYGHEYSEEADPRGVSIDPLRLSQWPDHGGLNLIELINYARSQEIGVFLYVNRRHLERYAEELFPLLRSWGVAGVKFGFVHEGPQGWTRWLHDTVRLAAENQLLVDIHDEYRPTGISRTLPNLLTQEGILGNEGFPSAEHNVTLPFTRFIAGAADYTICYRNKRLSTTCGHQIAMAAVYYSPLQFVYWYDRPVDYEGMDAELEFFDRVPTVWDETRVIAGEIGRYVAIARRNEREWFLGVMNGDEPRELALPLDFLDPSTTYTARRFCDALEGDAVNVNDTEVDRNVVLDLSLRAAGGEAVWIAPID